MDSFSEGIEVCTFFEQCFSLMYVSGLLAFFVVVLQVDLCCWKHFNSAIAWKFCLHYTHAKGSEKSFNLEKQVLALESPANSTYCI